MAKYYPTRRPQNGSITIYYIHKQEKVHFFIGKVVKKESDWIIPAEKDGYPYVKKKAKGAEEIQDAIDRKMKLIKRIVRDLEEDGLEPTATLVKDRHDKEKEAKERATREMESGITAGKLDVMAMAWKWWEAGKGPKKAWRPSSKKTIKESLEAFEAYIKTIKGDRKLLKSDLTLQLFQDYEAYLFAPRKLTDPKTGKETTKKPGLIKNAVGKRMKQIRLFLFTLEDLPFNPNKIKIHQIEKTPVALTEAELTKLENITLEGDLINKCRDMFLLGCYTSLRISDLKKLGEQHFHGDHIQIQQEKNDRTFKFPVTPQIRRILEKYEYKLPKVSEQDINEQIKIVAEKAGLDQPVELTKELKDRTLRYTKKKHEIISTHMAVKTFITLGLSWGVSIPDIAAVAGKHVRTIQGHYAAGDKEGAAEKLKDLWEQRTLLKVV